MHCNEHNAFSVEFVSIHSWTVAMILLLLQENLLELVHKLNRDAAVDGLLVQLPLPDHISEKKICQAVNPEKDVDGFHMFNIG